MKKKLLFITDISFILVLFLCIFSGCGRKAPPVAPEILKPYAVSKVRSVQNGDEVGFFIEYKGNADFFDIQTARVDCRSCPANYQKIKTLPGNERTFSISGYDAGDYKLKITAVLKNIESEPFIWDFKVDDSRK